ncbi:hypothetical protein NGTWS0302_15320 [Mycolicibacterium cyprinidarum]|uniref:DUF5642 domain-containing protein n=1 Tax=Mycolicibacterium cyprinidarum TaxID=2860311 RepID=A0ABQ4V9W0_9MYCO|nr:hypothetical protein NGTWS1702_37380 [Mycolicibacterium sp. NGTWSNA01]GJF17916.1 hypothetical protein NGTWS0302_15320 [Mycolicibacterium sp. NGTWS0302]GJF17961.1 hypothetical protein NGTWS1803_36430 [Mycolicibacterium sp. NGTWS1803]
MSNATMTLARLAVPVCVGLLTACGSDQAVDLSQADIANVAEIKSSFDAPFTVTTVGPAAIDPRLLGPQTLPPGLTFDPADCGASASHQTVPPGVKGNMAATTAEGEGVRYIVIAVETSEAVAVETPAEQCRTVKFDGPGLRGMVEVVEAPHLDGVHIVGTHRVLQTTADGGQRTGELYNYVANFGNFIVIVTANPLVLPDAPVVPVDTQRARELVTQAITLVRGGS